MPYDIVARLRGSDGGYFMRQMFTEAADEIDRLRAEIADMERNAAELRESLDFMHDVQAQMLTLALRQSRRIRALSGIDVAEGTGNG